MTLFGFKNSNWNVFKIETSRPIQIPKKHKIVLHFIHLFWKEWLNLSCYFHVLLLGSVKIVSSVFPSPGCSQNHLERSRKKRKKKKKPSPRVLAYNPMLSFNLKLIHTPTWASFWPVILRKRTRLASAPFLCKTAPRCPVPSHVLSPTSLLRFLWGWNVIGKRYN